VKLGLLVEAEEGLTWQRWQRLAQAADELGLDSLWVSDHLASAWDAHRRGLDAWMALAFAAVETRRVRLGTLVSPVTFRPPTILARMAEAVCERSQGRLTVGLGLGWNAREHAAAGLAFPAVEERLDLLRHSIHAVRQTLGERPVQVLVGGGGARTLRVAARQADEWNLTTNDPAAFSARAAVLDAECASIARRRDEIRTSVATGVLIGRDRRELEQRSLRMRARVPPLASVSVDEVPQAARMQGWVAGTVDEVAEQLQALHAVGVQRAVLGLYDLDDVNSVEIIAREVVPRLECK
jgi:alkanesulfonate monooxygenase SsuD/methylene tetrahydromethanopterin reductase-like flavin-dependent oxidoreductase (luciferase family)